MKFNIEKKDLLSITSTVYRAASNKNTIPLLSGLLLQVTRENGLTLTATDVEIGIKASLPEIDIIEEGSALVNAHYFFDFIKLLPDTIVTIVLDINKSKLVINYGRSSGFINIYRDHDYPDLPIQKMQTKVSLPQNILKEALRKTSFAAALNHFRQMFTGVLFDFENNSELHIVASDTHRLAYYKYVSNDLDIEPFNFILPLRTVNELLRLLDDTADIINIGFSENNVIFYKDYFLLLSRLIEGQYPNYKQVIPASSTTELKIATNIIGNALERAKIMPTDDKLKIHNVQFAFNKDEITITSNSEIMGELIEIIENPELVGENDFKIAFNTHYFLDIIKIFNSECEVINIKFSGSLGPAIITNEEKNNYLYVLVPLRINN